jgi:hypothetical protein
MKLLGYLLLAYVVWWVLRDLWRSWRGGDEFERARRR